MNISRDEWLKALGDAIKPLDPDALSLAELAGVLGVDRQMAYRHMRKLLRDGKAIAVQKMSVNSQGESRRVPAYKLVKPKAKK